jgi:rhamnogalacturonan endolyase
MASLPLVSVLRVATCLAAAFAAATTGAAAEVLERGVVAFPAKEGGVYVGWRLLADDPAAIAFDVYRADSPGAAARKLNPAPIAGSTNFVDRSAGGASARYSVRAVGAKTRAPDGGPVAVGERVEIGGMRRIKLQGEYKAQKVGLADLDGDGKLDFLVKHPDFNTDPYVLGVGYWKPST